MLRSYMAGMLVLFSPLYTCSILTSSDFDQEGQEGHQSGGFAWQTTHWKCSNNFPAHPASQYHR